MYILYQLCLAQQTELLTYFAIIADIEKVPQPIFSIQPKHGRYQKDDHTFQTVDPLWLLIKQYSGSNTIIGLIKAN